MTDYNDGKWHRWAGDGIPPGVHDGSWVEYGRVNGSGGYEKCKDIEWHRVCRFRVTKVYCEPQEFWVAKDKNDTVWSVYNRPPVVPWDEIIHVREVIE